MRITISNNADEANKGDLAILETMVALIRKNWPQAEICVLNAICSAEEVEAGFPYVKALNVKQYGAFFPGVFRGGSKAKELATAAKNLLVSTWILAVARCLGERGARLIPRGHRPAFLALSQADLVLLKGGSYIVSYGGAGQLLFLYRALLPTLVSLFMGKRVVILGHSIGPLEGLLSRRLALYCLKRMRRIAARERRTLRFLQQDLGLSGGKVELLPDLAFWFEREDMGKREGLLPEVLAKEGIEGVDPSRPKIGLTARPWHFPAQAAPEGLMRRYVDALARFADEAFLTYQANVFIMPHHLADLPVGKQILAASKHGNVFLLEGDYPTSVLRQIYGAMDVFVGTRTHSTIFSLTAGVPVIAIAYEIPKGFGILEMAGFGENVIDIASVSCDILLDKVSKWLRASESSRRALRRRMEGFQREIEKRVPEILRPTLDVASG